MDMRARRYRNVYEQAEFSSQPRKMGRERTPCPFCRRVALALVSGEDAPTYPEIAAALGLHLGTVHAHLRRIRLLHPEVWEAIMAERHRQLAERHAAAVGRAEAHSREWQVPGLTLRWDTLRLGAFGL